MSSMQEIKLDGEVEAVLFHNAENGWTALRFRNSETNTSVSGVGHFSAINQGEFLTFFGEWQENKTYGRQFKISRAAHTVPKSESAIVRYLSSGLFKGIGEKVAHRIVNRFGVKTLDIIASQPEQLREVEGVGKKTLRKILNSWGEQKQTSETTLFLYQHGITGATAQKILRRYGCNASTIIQNNPYVLVQDIRGIGFPSADKIARSIGLPVDAPQRVQEGIMHVLKIGEERGHCLLTDAQLRSGAREVLGLSAEQIADLADTNIDQLNANNRLASQQHGDQAAHYASHILLAEISIVRSIQRILSAPMNQSADEREAHALRVEQWLRSYSAQEDSKLSAQQERAVQMAATSKAFILTGGPGVGKSTTANALINLLSAMGRKFVLAAPTGRAAQRLQEITKVTAKTIHRLLEWSPLENGFQKNEDNPLVAQVVIIDEASMLDVFLADQLLRAVPSSAQLILIGDVHQLPSIGPGNLLKDLIDSKRIPCVELTEIFRQASTSDIICIAHQINRGTTIEFSDSPTSDCRFIPADATLDILGTIKKMVSQTLPDLGYDPKHEVQILTPMNRGDLGSINLNTELQNLLNPKTRHTREHRTTGLREGDKVIQTTNNYDLGVFNGDIGFVQHANVEGKRMVVRFDERTVYYDEEQVRELNLAYAITIHKSQGSEFKVVLIPLTMSHYIMLQRNLIYTALTRAKTLAILIGSMKAFQYAIKNETSSKRQTYLRQRLTKALGAMH